MNPIFSDAARSLDHLETEALLLPILVQLIVIIAAARAFGALARRVGQPSVVGEIVSGILLAIAVLAALDLFAAPAASGGRGTPVADVMGKIFTVIAGTIFLLFLVGDLKGPRRASGRAILICSPASRDPAPPAPRADRSPAHRPIRRGEVSLTGLTLPRVMSITAIRSSAGS